MEDVVQLVERPEVLRRVVTQQFVVDELGVIVRIDAEQRERERTAWGLQGLQMDLPSSAVG